MAFYSQNCRNLYQTIIVFSLFITLAFFYGFGIALGYFNIFIWGGILAYADLYLKRQAFRPNLIQAVDQPQPLPQEGHLHLNPEALQLHLGHTTHTASVHQSASTSAKKLIRLYGHAQSALLKVRIDGLRQQVESEPESPRKQVAIRCIDRLRDNPYLDSESKVNLNQLLGLAWVAICDDERREGSKEDAVNMLIEGLCEIQRGYNIPQDWSSEDIVICWPGSFNKIIEKLAGIHPGVKMQYITRAGASAKLRQLVKEKAKDFRHNNPSIDDDGLWETIKPVVADELYDEYQSVFLEGQNSPEFTAIIDAGEYALDM